MTTYCTTLTDLNECEVGAFTCAENEDCQDNVGGYDCVCSEGWYRRDGDLFCTGENVMFASSLKHSAVWCFHQLSVQILMNVKLRLMTVLTTAQTQMGHMSVHVQMASCFILMDYYAMVMIAQLETT